MSNGKLLGARKTRIGQHFRHAAFLWAPALAMFLAIGFAGCERRDDPHAASPKPVVQDLKPALSDRTASRPNSTVRQPSSEQEPSSPTSSLRAQAPVSSELQGKAPGSKLPLYELRMEPKDLLELERSAYSNKTFPATFTAEGVAYGPIQVRYRGAYARSWPKKPLKLIFTKDKPFDGHRHLNLNSGWRDPALIREHLAYHVYSACGVPASKSRMVRLDVNGQFRGLHVEVEQPEKAFALRIGLKGASIYKASSRANQADERDLGEEAAYQAHYEKETQKAEGYGELQKFCRDLARATNAAEFFNSRVDLEKYINYLAASVLLQNWDAYNKNHFLVYDGQGSKKWFVVPWDLDRTLGDYWDSSFDQAQLPVTLGTQRLRGITGWNRLQDRFFSDPGLRSRFSKRLAELLEKEFTKEKLFPILDRLEADIAPETTLDRSRWPGQSADLHGAIAQVKRYIERRRAYLLSEVEKMR